MRLFCPKTNSKFRQYKDVCYPKMKKNINKTIEKISKISICSTNRSSAYTNNNDLSQEDIITTTRMSTTQSSSIFITKLQDIKDPEPELMPQLQTITPKSIPMVESDYDSLPEINFEPDLRHEHEPEINFEPDLRHEPEPQLEKNLEEYVTPSPMHISDKKNIDDIEYHSDDDYIIFPINSSSFDTN